MIENKKSSIFYSHGKFFENEDEFLAFAKAWQDMPLDEGEFVRELERQLYTIKLNNEARGGILTNRQAYQILRLCTHWAAEKEENGKTV